MATLLLSAAGTALGGAMGGSLAGIGTAVLGGMISATILGVFFVPAFFVFVLKLFRTKRPEAEDAEIDGATTPVSHGSNP